MSKDVVSELEQITDVLTEELDKAPYVKGFRVGEGQALAVAIPKTLIELWQILKICVAHDLIILMQASNTGVTGGSTPNENNYDRDIVVVSTRHLKGLQLIQNAQQVLAFPGTTLTELENALKPHQREPHSVIGSSCIGASVIGGVCNNSGGSLIRRGPAFTEKSLFAQINAQGQLELVNHLGIDLGNTPEEIFSRLEKKEYTTGTQPDWNGRLWADGYAQDLRDVESSKPTRFNGNPTYLHDSAGCSGKLAVFAVRLPTFEASGASSTFYIGTNDEYELVELRRYLLQHLTVLPQQAEYIHKEAFDLTQQYAKHIYRAIDWFGAEKIPELFELKNTWTKRVQKIPFLPKNTVDRVIQWVNRITPSGIQKRIMDYHHQFEHHLMIKTDASQKQELQQQLQTFFANRTGQFFECNAAEEKNAFLIRFGVGGCTVYYCESEAINANECLIAFDFALRRNDDEWRIKLPPHLQEQIMFDSCCGHFFCFVNHQDYILKPNVDGKKFKQDVLKYLDERGAKYPAEHNVGHLYHASQDYQDHFKELDPTNSFNPGIGKTSKCKHWH